MAEKKTEEKTAEENSKFNEWCKDNFGRFLKYAGIAEIIVSAAIRSTHPQNYLEGMGLYIIGDKIQRDRKELKQRISQLEECIHKYIS